MRDPWLSPLGTSRLTGWVVRMAAGGVEGGRRGGDGGGAKLPLTPPATTDSRSGNRGRRGYEPPAAHFALNVTSDACPPFRSTVTGSVCSSLEPGFGCPRRTYRPGGTFSKDIWFLASMFPEPPYFPTASPPSGSILIMYPSGRSLPVKSTVTRTLEDFIIFSSTSPFGVVIGSPSPGRQ